MENLVRVTLGAFHSRTPRKTKKNQDTHHGRSCRACPWGFSQQASVQAPQSLHWSILSQPESVLNCLPPANDEWGICVSVDFTTTNTPKKEKEEHDINANPRVSTSTPLRRDEKMDSVSPMSETAESLCTSISGPGMETMVTSTMSGSSSGHSGAVLSQLYNDIYEQKDVIMSCLDEDNCDIEQVSLARLNTLYKTSLF